MSMHQANEGEMDERGEKSNTNLVRIIALNPCL